MPNYTIPLKGGGEIHQNGATLNDAIANANAATGGMVASGAQQSATGGGGGGGGGGGDLGAIAAGFAASSGFSIKQLNEQIREFDASLDWQKKMWEQQGLPQLVIQQKAQALEEAKFAELTQQAHRQQDWVEEIGRRQAALAEKTQADANAIAQGQLGLQGQQLGLDTLKTAASLSGPADWIKAANFSRGVAGSSLPGFVNDLLTGRSTATLGGAAPGASMSAPLTMGNLAARMGATGGAPALNAYRQQTQGPENLPAGTAPNVAETPEMAWARADPALKATYSQYNGGEAGGMAKYFQDAQAARAAAAAAAPAGTPALPAPAGSVALPTPAAAPATGVPAGLSAFYSGAPSNDVSLAQEKLRRVYEQGGQALGPQQLEGLTPTEMSMFTGGGSDIGADVPGFMTSYQRSRIGQTANSPAY